MSESSSSSPNIPAGVAAGPVPGTVVISSELQQQMLRDLLRHMSTRWYTVAFFVFFGLALLDMAAAAVMSADPVDLALVAALTLVAAAPVVLYWTTARRNIALAYPVGFNATAQVSDATLSSTTALGTLDLRFFAFNGVYPKRHSVLLSLRATAGGIGVMPRALLTDDGLAHLQSEVAKAEA